MVLFQVPLRERLQALRAVLEDMVTQSRVAAHHEAAIQFIADQLAVILSSRHAWHRPAVFLLGACYRVC